MAMARPQLPVGQRGGLRPQDLCSQLTAPSLTHRLLDTRPVFTNWKAGSWATHSLPTSRAMGWRNVSSQAQGGSTSHPPSLASKSDQGQDLAAELGRLPARWQVPFSRAELHPCHRDQAGPHEAKESSGVGKGCRHMPCLAKKGNGALGMGPGCHPSDLRHFPRCLAPTGSPTSRKGRWYLFHGHNDP